MSNTLALRDDVTFDLDGGWCELPARANALGDDGWQRWRAALGGHGDDTSFAWMDGLVPPETRALSEAYAKKVRAEQGERRRKQPEDPASASPLDEVGAYLRAAKRIAPLEVLARTDDATLVFVFVPRSATPTPSAR